MTTRRKTTNCHSKPRRRKACAARSEDAIGRRGRGQAPVAVTTARPSADSTNEDAIGSDASPEVILDPSKAGMETLRETIAPETQKESRFVVGSTVFCTQNPRRYLVLAENGEWKELSESDLLRRFRCDGLSNRDEQDRLLIRIQNDACVDYAAPLAGRNAGPFETNGKRILVTRSPKLVEPRSGSWKTLKALFEAILAKGDVEHGKRQVDLLYGWLKGTIADLHAGRRSQAQALVIAGPAGSGKSLLQKILTECIGGRSAKAYRYLSGATHFNSELAEAEHLMLDDEAVGKSTSNRDRIKAGIKNFTVSTNVVSVHPKNREAINLPVFWRLSISLNDEPDALRVLPPLDKDVADKLILLLANKNPFPMPTTTTEEKERFWATIMDELPAFLHWLLNEFVLPKALQDDRYQVKTCHHPKLREALENISDEHSLLALIDEILWEDSKRKRWVGTANDLHALLMENQRTRSRANKLLSWANATGTLLGKAKKLKPDRIKEKRTATVREWEIQRPPAGVKPKQPAAKAK
jgi:hypothetical protein